MRVQKMQNYFKVLSQQDYSNQIGFNKKNNLNQGNFLGISNRKQASKLAFREIKPEETSDKRPILIVTDAWDPFICGVSRSTKFLDNALKSQGYHVQLLTPEDFPGVSSKLILEGTLKLPISPGNKRKFKQKLESINPIGVYIATEGFLGKLAVQELTEKKQPFTTSYLTRWPEYLLTYLNKIFFGKNTDNTDNLGLIKGKIYNKTVDYLKWFHNSATNTLVTTDSMIEDLKKLGLTKVKKWSRAVDSDLFNPKLRDPAGKFNFTDPKSNQSVSSEGGKYKILGYIGRVAEDKNLNVLLELSKNKDNSINNGNYKVVIIGPAQTEEQLDYLRNKYPEVIFTGSKELNELPPYYANLDVFVFPSQKDTFGIVQLEALSCGTPVAAYYINGPKDIIKDDKVGCLEKNLTGSLNTVIKQSLTLKREDCRQYILNNPQYSWQNAAKDLAKYMEKIQDNVFNKKDS